MIIENMTDIHKSYGQAFTAAEQQERGVVDL